MNTIKGLIIRESLIGNKLPGDLRRFVVNEYDYQLEGDKSSPVKIYVLMIPKDDVSAVSIQLAKQLVPKLYYAHFIVKDVLHVIFPNTVCLVNRDDDSSAEQCRVVGRIFDIPDEQMPFERLFDDDHPND